jgi:predicted acyl esterase
MSYIGNWQKIAYGNADFFTVVCLPEKAGKFPTVLCRTPYTGSEELLSEDEIVEKKQAEYHCWLEAGYAMVYQHCRGKGKSSGDFVPYICEREDGLFLQEWVRRQPFYNGELFLMGGSYTASLHYATAPFARDIKGAIFEVQDSERYRLWYRNGQMRKGHADWHFRLMEAEGGLDKAFTKDSFSQLPLIGLSERALGTFAEDFEQMLMAPSPLDPFWQTRFGGGETVGKIGKVGNEGVRLAVGIVLPHRDEIDLLAQKKLGYVGEIGGQ